jgi:hypothetical protein
MIGCVFGTNYPLLITPCDTSMMAKQLHSANPPITFCLYAGRLSAPGR